MNLRFELFGLVTESHNDSGYMWRAESQSQSESERGSQGVKGTISAVQVLVLEKIYAENNPTNNGVDGG